MHCCLTIPITNFFFFLCTTVPHLPHAWWRSMMACGGSQMSWSRLMSQSQAMTSSPGSQGAATTISSVVPCWNRETIPARMAGEIASRAASAWPSIMLAIMVARLPGGSVAVILSYVSAARAKSTLTRSPAAQGIALSGSWSWCCQRLARSMCPWARHMVLTAAAKPASRRSNVKSIVVDLWWRWGSFPFIYWLRPGTPLGVDPQKVPHQSGVTIRLSHGLSLDFIGYWSFDTMYIAQCCPVPIKCDEN